ncbi:MAG: glycoside hydrolase family 127 protein [Phycisphaeraceae bacterium]|nr:glycoside hydrolase family 127 protein [Phycisphaeraceae bacterium]
MNPTSKLIVKNMRGQIGQRYEATWRNNLLKLDWDGEFLKPFAEKTATSGYVGLGKCVDALVRFTAMTQDPTLLALRTHVIDTMLKCQTPQGYLGLYAPKARTMQLWDIHELAYVLWGLLTDWAYFQHKPSRSAAIKLGEYLLKQMADVDPTQLLNGDQDSVAQELNIIGLDRSLLALTQVTGDVRYQNYVVTKLKIETWDLPIVLERHGKIEGHAYAYLTRCLAQLDLYEQTKNNELLKQTRQAMFFLVHSLGLVITGSCSISECWHDDQRGNGELAETCATAYLIRVCARLLRYDNDGKWADLMERTIYNALFAAQSSDGRKIRYYTPFEGPRQYYDTDTYCCPNNYRRIVSELPDLIYDWQEQILQVNLYETSAACIELADGQQATIEQITNYPSDGEINFYIELDHDACFALRLRQPRWCDDAHLIINGELQKVAVEKGFLTIFRTWQSSDHVRLTLSIKPRLVQGLAKQAGKVAVMRGPVVYCAQASQINIKNVDGKSSAVDQAHDLGAFTSLVIQELPQTQMDLSGPPLVLKGQVDSPDGCQCYEVVIPLMPYPDPDGDRTYFKVGPTVAVVRDHLLAKEVQQDSRLKRHHFDPDAIKT